MTRALAVGLLALAASMPPGALGAPTGNPARGEALYGRCQACHALGYDRTGPRHCGLFGRRAGSVPGFAYSPAMARSGIVWNEKTLDRFLAGPVRMVPGTSMGYAGLPDARERADLIAWLKQASRTSPDCPPPDAAPAP